MYQARLKGAAALVAVQDQGYGEIHDTALNAQDIAGPEDAAAFSISRSDADIIRTSMKDNEAQVLFDAQSTVKRGCEDYNIVGCIPGQEEEGKILLTAHYDSYFSGFQDDNAAVAMMLQAQEDTDILRHGSGGVGRGRIQVRLVRRGL